MADEKRRVASAIYITALVGTLLAVFLIPNPTGKMFAAILCIVVQFCALAWYTVRVPANAVLRARARRWGGLWGGATAPEPRRPPTCVARLRAGTPPEEGGQTRERPRLGERCSVWRRLLNTPSHPVLALPSPRLPPLAGVVHPVRSVVHHGRVRAVCQVGHRGSHGVSALDKQFAPSVAGRGGGGVDETDSVRTGRVASRTDSAARAEAAERERLAARERTSRSALGDSDQRAHPRARTIDILPSTSHGAV